jgi:hypothetical protein
MKDNDKLWFEGLSAKEIALYTSDGLSLYDLQNLDGLNLGQGTRFHAQLVRLFGAADLSNKQRLGVGFPGTWAAIASRQAFHEGAPMPDPAR